MSAVNWKNIVKAVEGSDFTASGKSSPRERFASNLKTQIALFKEPKKEGKRHFEVKGESVKFTARLGNMAVELLPGKKAVVIPSKDFPAVLEAIVEDVEKGQMDAQLNKIAENYSQRRKKG